MTRTRGASVVVEKPEQGLLDKKDGKIPSLQPQACIAFSPLSRARAFLRLIYRFTPRRRPPHSGERIGSRWAGDSTMAAISSLPFAALRRAADCRPSTAAAAAGAGRGRRAQREAPAGVALGGALRRHGGR